MKKPLANIIIAYANENPDDMIPANAVMDIVGMHRDTQVKREKANNIIPVLKGRKKYYRCSDIMTMLTQKRNKKVA